MKSPISGKEMSVQMEDREMTYRKEDYVVPFRFYLCEDSGQKFTSNELDEINLGQLMNQYRSAHNLLFVNQIREIRANYGVSAKMMSELLGFGVNTYSNYEKGEVPNASNNNLMKMIEDPEKFRDLVAGSGVLDEGKRDELIERVDQIIAEQRKNPALTVLAKFFMGPDKVDIYTGYQTPSIEKFAEMVVFFAHAVQPYKTVLNKLLFYSDFLCFKNTFASISGARYFALEWGPIPNRFQSIFEFIQCENKVTVAISEFPSGAVGEVFKPRESRAFDPTVFNDVELEILDRVAKKFGRMQAKKISELSHEELGWIDNRDSRSEISYQYAFDLKHV